MFLRVCGAVILTVVLLCSGAYVARGLHGAAEVADARERAATAVVEALPAAQERAIAERDRVRPALAARWGSPAYSWQELICDLDTRDAGWIVQSYEQYCRISTVDLVPVPAASGSECEDLWVRSGPLSGVKLVRGPATALGQEEPYLAMCPDGVLAPQRSGTTRLLSGARPTDLEESAGWLVVRMSTEVSRTDLGCDPWALLFCNAPVDDPVLGEVG